MNDEGNLRPRYPGSSPQNPRILVVGAGAIGGYYAGKLAQSGAIVSTVHHSQADYDAVRTHGIHVESIHGDFHYHPFSVHREVPGASFSADTILVAVKALPDLDVAELIRPAVREHTVIVLLQNGLGNEELIAKAFPRNTLISGLAFICVSRIRPGVLRHLCYGRLSIGLYPRGVDDHVRGLSTLFESSGVSCAVCTDIIGERWKKLVWNAAFNPISVLGHQATTRDMMDSGVVRTLIENVMREVCRLARAEGYPLDEEAMVAKNMGETDRMESYKTSMLLDFEAGRPLEVEAILGYASRVARKHGIAAPCLNTLHALLTLATRPKVG
ncbi:MAG: 2-dehydropantoate 2-reductase [Magnetococcales bacterium]|nr:2-dehydropantoate 2-reductase [Magnetococcales bacterium]MBF0148579.1 2-dehydropantoate 2-reductase [Magnetococcales bacterium]MBF0172291.1 2-dehydropantoate 2-reductase [Magnetococcales bacterium]MBF0629728.1 2-dehydropantoate 2-reductase [Magnetococcales bacterium]